MSKRKHKQDRKRSAEKRAERQGVTLQRLREKLRLYEAASTHDWRPQRGSGASADSTIQSAGTRLRQAARYADENDGLAIAVLDDLLDNTVAAGRPVSPMVRRPDGAPADRTNAKLRKWWRRLWERPEVTGQLTGDEVERLAARTWLRDGELLIHHVLNPPRTELPHGLGYLLELLEPDYMPHDLVYAAQNSAPGAYVVHGVELNRWRRPLAYHVLRGHPGGTLPGELRAGDTQRIPADRMTHLAFRRRLHQTRGVTVLHGALTTMQDIREAWESERIAMRIAAAMTAFVRRGPDFQNAAQLLENIGDSHVGARGFELSPGMVWDSLLPGEEVGTISSDRPNQNFDPFTAALQRTVAGSTGARFSAIAHRYDGTYSSQRQELVEGAIAYRRLFGYLLGTFYRPIYRRAVDVGLLMSEVRITESIDRDTLYEVDIPPPALPWIDQEKEIKAYALAMEQKLISRHQAIRELGRDPVMVDQMIEEEASKLADLMTPPSATAPPGTQAGGDDQADDDDQADSEDDSDAA